MRVLVVDDDRTTRFLLRRSLLAELGCEVAEASDGLAALDALSKARYDLVILDVQMPVMDGLETIRALRSAPEFVSLPVVMLTAERSADIVQQIIALGVLDYMTKPLIPARVVARLRRVMRWLGTPVEAGTDPSRAGERQGFEKAASLLIVDGNEAFRGFFAEVLSPLRTVLTAETGTGAFRLCLDANPGAVFIGSGLGVLNDALLVRKIRSTPALSGTHLIAVADSQEEAAARMAGYDGTILRTRQAEVLLRQFESLSGKGGGAIQRLLGICPELTGLLAAAGEQVLGMTLSTEVSVRDGALLPAERVVVSSRGKWDEGGRIRVLGCCDVAAARHMAGHLLGIDPAMVHDEDVDAGGSEVLTNVLDRFCGALNAKQVPMQFEPPVVTRCHGQAAPPADDLVAVCLQSASGEMRCWLMIEDEEAGDAGAPPPIDAAASAA